DEPRAGARPGRDDAARNDARGRKARRVPPEPLAALPRTRLLRPRVPPAHDARRDRKLSRALARDGEPALLALPGRGPGLGAAEAYPHPGRGRAAPCHGARAQLRRETGNSAP